MHWFGYTLVYLAPLLTFVSYGFGPLFILGLGLLTFGVLPLLDHWLGDDWEGPEQETEASLRQAPIYHWILYPFVPLQLGLLLWSCYLAASAGVAWEYKLGLLLMVGIINGGFSINIAHELSHRKSKGEQFLAKCLWFRVGYLHFPIEHLYGHHPRLGLPEDHATARLGESVYQFYLRCIPGSFASAWRLESDRLKQKQYAQYSWHNHMLWAIFLPLIFTGLLLGAWGWQAGLFYLLQCLLAIFVLETVNYLEHYGLERQQLDSGHYEKIGIQHSWNSSRRLSNFFLHKLQRHSDHHLHAHRPYQILRAFPEAPQLPTGYGWMILLALIPPLWRRVMDPRVKAYQQTFQTEPLVAFESQSEVLI